MSRERDEGYREREERRDQPAADAPNEAFKAFIGGISFQIDDLKLLDGEILQCQAAMIVIVSGRKLLRLKLC